MRTCRRMAHDSNYPSPKRCVPAGPWAPLSARRTRFQIRRLRKAPCRAPTWWNDRGELDVCVRDDRPLLVTCRGDASRWDCCADWSQSLVFGLSQWRMGGEGVEQPGHGASSGRWAGGFRSTRRRRRPGARARDGVCRSRAFPWRRCTALSVGRPGVRPGGMHVPSRVCSVLVLPAERASSLPAPASWLSDRFCMVSAAGRTRLPALRPPSFQEGCFESSRRTV